MATRYVAALVVLASAFSAGYLAASDATPSPITPAPVSTPAATPPPAPVVVPAPLPDSCADVARVLASMAGNEATLSRDVGRLQLVIDTAERALVNDDLPAYNEAMEEVRDIRSSVAVAASERQSDQPRLDRLAAQCASDTTPTN